MLDFKGFASKILKEKKTQNTSFSLNCWPQVYTSIANDEFYQQYNFYLQILVSKSEACSQLHWNYCKLCFYWTFVDKNCIVDKAMLV